MATTNLRTLAQNNFQYKALHRIEQPRQVVALLVLRFRTALAVFLGKAAVVSPEGPSPAGPIPRAAEAIRGDLEFRVPPKMLRCDSERHATALTRKAIANGVSGSGSRFVVYQCPDEKCAHFLAVTRERNGEGLRVIFQGRHFRPRDGAAKQSAVKLQVETTDWSPSVPASVA